MLISQEIDKDFNDLIAEKDWSDCCPDKEKYNSDPTYKNEYHKQIYDKYSVELELFIDKALEPFRRNGWCVTLTSKNIKDHIWYNTGKNLLCQLNYNITYSNDKKTNPFNTDMLVIMDKPDVMYFMLKNPSRIYFQHYINHGNWVNCNPRLFTSRGFRKYGYQTYKYIDDIDKWSNAGGTGDKIIDYLKKTLVGMKNNYEKIQKTVQVKQKERRIQLDEITCTVAEMNNELKDLKIKFLFDGDCNFDYVDSPIRFDLVLSNNPEQDDENLYVKKDKEVILGDNWRTNREDEHFKKLFEENKINLFTYELGTSGYNSSYKVTCFYNNPRYHSKWHIKLESWRISSDVFNKLFGELEYDFDDLDALKDTLISLFKKDNQIYEKLKEFIQ